MMLRGIGTLCNSLRNDVLGGVNLNGTHVSRARGGAERRAPPAERPAFRSRAALRLPSDVAVADSILVLHRALPDLQRMKLC